VPEPADTLAADKDDASDSARWAAASLLLQRKGSTAAVAIEFHATERCTRMRPIVRTAAASVEAVVSGEPGRRLARDEQQVRCAGLL
jgi:hypothetical protein